MEMEGEDTIMTGMSSEEYKQAATSITHFITDYFENIRDRPVLPDVEPGYLRNMVPASPPEKPEPWDDIFADFHRVVMPGLTHWQSPHMHGYFPALTSYPSLLGEMLADAINCIGFTWAASPACTELEALVLDWLAYMIDLPDKFIHGESSTAGGGLIQTTLSDSTFVSLLAARNDTIAQYSSNCGGGGGGHHTGGAGNLSKQRSIGSTSIEYRGEIGARLVAYCSDQAHSSIEKACYAALIELRIVPSDENFSMRGSALDEAIHNDIKLGKLPFYVAATLGTTGCCAFDNLEEIAAICKRHKLWLHVDAAYAGSTFVCPEFRHFMAGIEHADSFAFNPSKYLLVNFDCTAMWVADSRLLHRTFNVDPLYLQHDKSGAAIDYMHWQIPLSRRFRALKLWFVIRTYGVAGLQKHIRHGIERAKHFESLVRSNSNFQICAKRHLGLTVFSLKSGNSDTEALLKAINHDRRLHCVPANLRGTFVIRFVVTSPETTDADIDRDWQIIETLAKPIIERQQLQNNKTSILESMKQLNNNESSLSLLLCHSPESPRLINCSYAAVKGDPVVEKIYHESTSRATSNSSLYSHLAHTDPDYVPCPLTQPPAPLPAISSGNNVSFKSHNKNNNGCVFFPSSTTPGSAPVGRKRLGTTSRAGINGNEKPSRTTAVAPPAPAPAPAPPPRPPSSPQLLKSKTMEKEDNQRKQQQQQQRPSVTSTNKLVSYLVNSKSELAKKAGTFLASMRRNSNK